MSLPTLATTEDAESVVTYLRTKPLGASISEAKATLDPKLLDSKRLSAYQSWGLIAMSGDKLTLTPQGRKLSQASGKEKSEIFANILYQERIYLVTLENAYHRNVAQVTIDDVAAHWVEHFSNEVATGSERSLKEQVTCFMSIAAAAGLGEYLIGRRGAPTRLEIHVDQLETFIREPNEDDFETEDEKQNSSESTYNMIPNDYKDHTPAMPTQPIQQIASNAPSLHIDIQIHIDSDATPEQIDKIFESMAKHLYNKGNN